MWTDALLLLALLGLIAVFMRLGLHKTGIGG